MTFAGQVLSGSTFAYGPTYFFQQAGISTNKTYQIAVGGTAIAFVGTIISWPLLGRFGRRTLYVTGMAIDCLLLLIVGILASTSNASGAKWGQAALCLLWLFVYSSTIGKALSCVIPSGTMLTIPIAFRANLLYDYFRDFQLETTCKVCLSFTKHLQHHADHREYHRAIFDQSHSGKLERPDGILLVCNSVLCIGLGLLPPA